MIDDATIRRLAIESGLTTKDGVGPNEKDRAFVRAVWSLGRDAGLEEAAQFFLDEDNKRMFHSEMLWPHQVSERICALKESKP